MSRSNRERLGVRALLLGLVLFGAAGLVAELYLMEHYDSWTQIVPFAVLGCGLAVGVPLAYRPTRRIVRGFQAVMWAVVLTGLVGLWLHYRGNAVFELEIAPSARGFDLVWDALRGAIPTLAPGAFVPLGLLGIIWSYHHPAMCPGASTQEEEGR
jgi:hypothetical protein